jgi:hypothetical protein
MNSQEEFIPFSLYKLFPRKAQDIRFNDKPHI